MLTCLIHCPVIIDMHFNAFPDTRLIMLIGESQNPLGDEILKYALDRGAGWRADCFGDYKEGWNHMEDAYPVRIEAVASEAWKTAPVAFETCGNVQTWYDNGYDIDQIILDAKNYHVSVLNGKSVGFPEERKEKLEELTKVMGYRLFISKISHLESFDPAKTNEISIEIENKGIAPAYKSYDFAVRLKSLEDGSEIIHIEDSIVLESILPGLHSFKIQCLADI